MTTAENTITNDLITIMSGLRFPEGPAFAPDGSLWLVELHGESLVNIKNGTVKRFKVGGKPNGIAFDKLGKLWFCDSGLNAIRCFDLDTEEVMVKASQIGPHALDGPNDLAFDSQDNLIFTCPGNSRTVATGYVCVLSPQGGLKKIAENLFFPNGLAFSPAGDELIIAETYQHRLWRGNWNAESCEWTNIKVFVETGGPIGPDGMAFDSKGNLYVAVYGSGRVKVYSSFGLLIKEICLPGNNPTNCAFDPNEKSRLMITEAEKGLLLSYQNIN